MGFKRYHSQQEDWHTSHTVPERTVNRRALNGLKQGHAQQIYNPLQPLIHNHMWQDRSESAREQKAALYKSGQLKLEHPQEKPQCGLEPPWLLLLSPNLLLIKSGKHNDYKWNNICQQWPERTNIIYTVHNQVQLHIIFKRDEVRIHARLYISLMYREFCIQNAQ